MFTDADYTFLTYLEWITQDTISWLDNFPSLSERFQGVNPVTMTKLITLVGWYLTDQPSPYAILPSNLCFSSAISHCGFTSENLVQLFVDPDGIALPVVLL